MQTTYREIPAADAEAHFLPEDLRGLKALGFREVDAIVLSHSHPGLPASIEARLFAAPDGSALASLHGLTADDPSVEIRTLLKDGTLIQTARRRRAVGPQLMHLAHGAWPSLTMYVVPGDDHAPIATVWAEHQHAVADLMVERGSRPGTHAGPQCWIMMSPRAGLPFRAVRRADEYVGSG